MSEEATPMTITPEQRAEQVAQRMHPLGPKKAQVMMGRDSFVALIAAAIREAEDAALESAASICDEWFDRYAMADHCEYAAREIRYLKHKD